MWRLDTLTLERFRSFREKAKIEFSSPGMLLIRGAGSGIGKSTVVLGVADALGVCPVPATQLRSWGAKDPRKVSLSLTEDDGRKLAVTRGSGIELEVNGEEVKGSASHKAQALMAALGLKDPAWITPLTYRPQRARSFFLNFSDAEKKEFLGGILGIDTIEKSVEDSEATQKSLESELASTEPLWARLDFQKAACENNLLGRPEAAVLDRARLEFVEAGSAASKASECPVLKQEQLSAEEAAQIAALEAGVPAAPPLMAEIEKRINKISSTKDTATKDWAREMAAHEAKRKEHARAIAKATELSQVIMTNTREMTQAKERLAVAQPQTCPTCDQSWHGGDAHIVKLKETIEDKESLLATLAGIKKALEKTPEYQDPGEPPEAPDLSKDDDAVRKMRARFVQLNEEWHAAQAGVFSQIEKINSDLAGRRARAASEFEAANALWASKLATAMAELASRNAELKAAEEAEARAQEAERVLTRTLDELATIEVNRDALKKWIAEERDFQALVGPKGFLGTIFDEILDEISKEATEIASVLPNVSQITVELRSTKTTLSKQTKKTILPVFHVHGEEVSLGWDQVFSGGQVAALDLAIDLAIGKVIARRTGVALGWLILDEPFFGLPAKETEEMLATLRVLATEILVIVIDHSSETQESFDNVLEVCIDAAGSSRLVEAAT